MSTGPCDSLVNLPEGTLLRIIDKFATDTVSAAALTGSFAREDADRYSDIDLLLFDETLPNGKSPVKQLTVRHDRLISLTTATAGFWREHFDWPSTAVYTVPAFRNLRPLFDQTGVLAELVERAQSFSWDPLQTAADEFVREKVVQQAEVAHKLLSGIERREPERLAVYAWEIVNELSLAVAVHRRIFIESGNHTFAEVCRAQGIESPWTQVHRRASGKNGGVDGGSTVLERGVAALRLYQMTATIIEDLLQLEGSEATRHATLGISSFLNQDAG